ncbi:hypothetical protein RRF57_010630 [Xylaria bambusicola]|uniref:Uncharacterized protein n=1 Tax=Xylaria bambusicola TaxID=326684 RepID=A0AAN7USQ8_9PEZI
MQCKFMLTVIDRYQRSLAARPLLTQSLTTAVLFAVGDITAQQGIEKKGLEKHEFVRTGRMFAYGGGMSFFQLRFLDYFQHKPPERKDINTCISGTMFYVRKRKPTNTPSPFPAVFGPAATIWFKILSKRVVLPNKNAEILARVACDQLLFAPVFIGVFLSSMGVLEGSSPKEKLDKSYVDTLQTNWMVWPFVQLANFKFVPLQHRVLAVNVASIGWNSYLSLANAK